MARWDPDGRGRLEQAAMALYAERGFDDTTVAAIAERAGLTERTFFRHYADKREVLFGGSGELQDLLVRAVADAPASLSPLEAAARGVEAMAMRLEGRRPFSQQRQAIIANSTELRERELIKLAALSAAAADTLRARGAGEPAASLAAEAAIAVFRTAFERWVDERNDRPFTALVRETFDELKAVAAG
jgi:AcrR family transcriptional regulator